MRYPTEIFLTILGVPAPTPTCFVPWVEDFFAGFGGDPDGSSRRWATALGGIREYWVAALEERRGEAEPARERPRLPSAARRPSTSGRWPTSEILDMLTVLVLAGLDTTRGQLGYLFRHLAEHPDDRQRLIDEPELIPSAVEESLRYYTIIFGDGRKVTRTPSSTAARSSKGDMVYGLVSGANRDPRVVRARRTSSSSTARRNNHLGFAGGPHRCLGAHLARMVMQVAVEEWLTVIPDFEVVTETAHGARRRRR